MFKPVTPPFGIRKGARRTSLRRTRRKDRGASAVEFALVSPLVFTLLFGAIDYGLYFADAMTVQQGAVDAARNATLSVGGTAANWPGDASCLPGLAMSGAGNDLAKVACSLSTSVQPIGGGTLVVKAEVVTPDGTPTTSWAQPNRLRVCAMVKHTAVLPFVPMPGGGLITSKVDMPIQPGNALLALNAVTQDPAIAGANWTWC
jgi:Flp pilus assembly protein TadG